FDRASNVSTDGPTVTVRIDTLPPSWPNGAVLTATRIDPSTVALAWSTANDDVLVAGYRLFQNGQPSTDVGAGTHTFTVAALDPSAAYTFQVQAFDAAGNVSTDGPRVDVGASVGAPTWPDGSALFVLPNGAAGTVQLFWQPADDDVGVTGYALFQDGRPLAQVS